MAREGEGKSANAAGANPLLDRPERRKVEMRGFAVRANKEIVELKVLDLSYNGCGIECVTELTGGEVVRLSVLGRGAVGAEVKWWKARKAGLQFIDSRGEAQRTSRERREQIALPAQLRRSSKRAYQVTAIDLSATGCRCEFVDRPQIGERLWIKFDGLEALQSEVTWVEEFNAGLRFETPLHPAVFDMLLARWGKA